MWPDRQPIVKPVGEHRGYGDNSPLPWSKEMEIWLDFDTFFWQSPNLTGCYAKKIDPRALNSCPDSKMSKYSFLGPESTWILVRINIALMELLSRNAVLRESSNLGHSVSDDTVKSPGSAQESFGAMFGYANCQLKWLWMQGHAKRVYELGVKITRPGWGFGLKHGWGLLAILSGLTK